MTYPSDRRTLLNKAAGLRADDDQQQAEYDDAVRSSDPIRNRWKRRNGTGNG